MIINALIIRFIYTLIIYYLNINNFYKVILILLADYIDCFIINYIGKTNCKTFLYQIGDKLLDLFSYYLIYKLLNLDILYLYVIIYRLIGVFLFSISNSRIFLIIFGDYFKEILVYNYLFHQLNFKKIDYGIIIIIIIKTIFEYYWHIIKNPISYK